MSATFVHEIPSKCFECVGTGNKKALIIMKYPENRKKMEKMCFDWKIGISSCENPSLMSSKPRKWFPRRIAQRLSKEKLGIDNQDPEEGKADTENHGSQRVWNLNFWANINAFIIDECVFNGKRVSEKKTSVKMLFICVCIFLCSFMVSLELQQAFPNKYYYLIRCYGFVCICQILLVSFESRFILTLFCCSRESIPFSQ